MHALHFFLHCHTHTAPVPCLLGKNLREAGGRAGQEVGRENHPSSISKFLEACCALHGTLQLVGGVSVPESTCCTHTLCWEAGAFVRLCCVSLSDSDDSGSGGDRPETCLWAFVPVKAWHAHCILHDMHCIYVAGSACRHAYTWHSVHSLSLMGLFILFICLTRPCHGVAGGWACLHCVRKRGGVLM